MGLINEEEAEELSKHHGQMSNQTGSNPIILEIEAPRHKGRGFYLSAVLHGGEHTGKEVCVHLDIRGAASTIQFEHKKTGKENHLKMLM